MKQYLELFGPMDQRYIWRKKNEANSEKNTLQLSMVALSNGLGLLCFLWHCKPAACGRQVEFIEVSGNPNAVSEEAESWVPLDLPTRQ